MNKKVSCGFNLNGGFESHGKQIVSNWKGSILMNSSQWVALVLELLTVSTLGRCNGWWTDVLYGFSGRELRSSDGHGFTEGKKGRESWGGDSLYWLRRAVSLERAQDGRKRVGFCLMDCHYVIGWDTFSFKGQKPNSVCLNNGKLTFSSARSSAVVSSRACYKNPASFVVCFTVQSVRNMVPRFQILHPNLQCPGEKESISFQLGLVKSKKTFARSFLQTSFLNSWARVVSHARAWVSHGGGEWVQLGWVTLIRMCGPYAGNKAIFPKGQLSLWTKRSPDIYCFCSIYGDVCGIIHVVICAMVKES